MTGTTGRTMRVPRLRAAVRDSAPGSARERALWAEGHDVVVGLDEVGRGAWAGPLTIGAVVAPPDRRLYKVRDSKQLTGSEREAMFDRIAGWARAWSIGHASPRECDELGMSEAQRLAARRALDGLGLTIERVLVDGRWDFVSEPGGGASSPVVETIVRGDASSLSIAAASILAKVTRDRIMRRAARGFPGYDLEFNKGYPCARHRAALAGWGPTSIHRRSWAFMDDLCWSGIERYHRPDPQRTLF